MPELYLPNETDIKRSMTETINDVLHQKLVELSGDKMVTDEPLMTRKE